MQSRAFVTDKTGTDGYVTAIPDLIDQVLYITGVVLSVSVKLNDYVVSMIQSIFKTGLNSTKQSQIAK